MTDYKSQISCTSHQVWKSFISRLRKIRKESLGAQEKSVFVKTLTHFIEIIVDNEFPKK